MPAKQYPRGKPKKPSANDLADKALLAAVDKAVVDALRPVLAENKDRFLRELQPHHITAISVAAVSEYIAVRRLMELAADLNDEIPDLALS